MKKRIRLESVYITVQALSLLAKLCGVPMSWYTTLLPTVVYATVFLLAIAITLYMGRPIGGYKNDNDRNDKSC